MADFELDGQDIDDLFDGDDADGMFDDLDEDLDEDMFDGIDAEIELSEVDLRTAVLQKNGMVALLCIKKASAGAAICRVDPRESQPSVQVYDDPMAAEEWFTRSLGTSRKNGWKIVYDGLPLRG